MKVFGVVVLLLCACHANAFRGQADLSIDVDGVTAHSAYASELEAPGADTGKSTDWLLFPREVLISPECAPAGEIRAEGYLLFTENKDTNDRNFNSVDVGLIPARLPGPVQIEFTAKYAFLEVVDIGHGIDLVSWTDDDFEDTYMTYLGSNFSEHHLPSEGFKVVSIEPSVPTALLVRVVIHIPAELREGMQEDGAAWSVSVSWESPAQSTCQKSLASGVRVPVAQLQEMHTSQYMPFMPGFLAVLRRGRNVRLQLPEPSPEALELLRLKASERCASLPQALCNPDSDVSLHLLEFHGFACSYKDSSGSCEASGDFYGPKVELEGNGLDNGGFWVATLEVRKAEVKSRSAEELCNRWNVPDEQRVALLRQRLGFLPDDWKEKSDLICTNFLGEMALVHTEGAESCAWEDGKCHSKVVGQATIERTVVLPPTLPIGRATLLVNGEFAGAVAIICNPWSEEDPTYLTVAGLKNSTHDAGAAQRLAQSLKDYDDDEARRDYVLKTDGFIFKGATGNGLKDVYGDPWDFQQFRSLYFVLPLLDRLPAYLRTDIVMLSRKVPVLINSHVLAGNWGEIKDGERPGFWNSGGEILHRAYRMSPIEKAGGEAFVRWGQCFVFAGVTGSVLRSLGIPSRVVTNFESAHDHQPYDFFIRESDGDSVWNFHVWNEAWFSRDDLYGSDKVAQWNVLDATPQELSDGEMQMGPAAMSVVRRGADDSGPLSSSAEDLHLNARMNYDVAFAIGEANAVRLLRTSEDNEELLRKVWEPGFLPQPHNITCEEACLTVHSILDLINASSELPAYVPDLDWKRIAEKINAACPASCAKPEDMLLDFHSVGQYMSTEAPRCNKRGSLVLDTMGSDSCREDVTANYKTSLCPTKEFCAKMKAQDQKVKNLNMGARTYLTWEPKLARVGDAVTFNLWQEVARPRFAVIRVEAVTYTDQSLGVIADYRGPWDNENLKLKVTPEDYFPMLGRTHFMRVVAVTWPQLEGDVEVQKSSFHAKEVVTLLPNPPELRLLKVGAAPTYNLTEEVQWFVGDIVTVGVRWQNPFQTNTTYCEVGWMITATQFVGEPLPPLEALQHLDMVFEHDVPLVEAGQQHVSVALHCMGMEEMWARFSFLVEERISSADQELNNVFGITHGVTTSPVPVKPSAPVSPASVTTSPKPASVSPASVTTSPKPASVNSSEGVKHCRVGEHVPCCPDGKCSARCAGDQCCPGRPLGIEGTFTCPSASKPNAQCTHPKVTDCTAA